MLRLAKARRIRVSLFRLKSSQRDPSQVPSGTGWMQDSNKLDRKRSELTENDLLQLPEMLESNEPHRSHQLSAEENNEIKEQVEHDSDFKEIENEIFRKNPNYINPIYLEAPIFDDLYEANERERKIQSTFESQTMQEMMNLHNQDKKMAGKVRSLDLSLRRGLFNSTYFQKMAIKEYIKYTKKTGHNEFLLEVLLRNLSVYTELKGEVAQRGKDVYGPEYWNSSFFSDIHRDLGYLTLPGVELDTQCLLSLFDSFSRLKYKDHRILGPLSMKLVLGIRSPDDSFLYSHSNEFSAFNIKEFVDENVERSSQNLDSRHIMDKFMYHKFGDLDLDSALGSQMRQKLENYLLMEIERQDLFLNIKYDQPSQAKFFGVVNEDSMKQHLQTILTLDHYDMIGPDGLESTIENLDGLGKISSSQMTQTETQKEGVDQASIDSIDQSLNAIEAGIQSLSKQHLKIFDSFLALRENYFKLNNLQRDWLILNNPDILLDILTLEETLVKLGVVLPTEADFYVNRANYKNFEIDPTDFRKKYDITTEFGEINQTQIENVKVKNALLFKGFASRLGIDVELAEKCIYLAEQSRMIQIENQDRGFKDDHIDNLVYKMEKNAKIQKMVSLSAYIGFLELGFGDTIDPDQNYVLPGFETLFGFEKSMRFWSDEHGIVQNILHSHQNHDIVDPEHDKIARYYYHKQFAETQRQIKWALSNEASLEDRLSPTMGFACVFTRGILKAEANQCALKLALIGKLLNIPNSPENFQDMQDSRPGTTIDFPIYSQTLTPTHHIKPLENGQVWVSEELYHESRYDIKNFNPLLVIEFMEAIQRLPTELMMEIVGSSFGNELCRSIQSILESNDYRFEQKCWLLSRSFAIRELCRSGLQLTEAQSAPQIGLNVAMLKEVLHTFDSCFKSVLPDLLSDNNFLQFVTKNGKRPIPNSNWHLDMFDSLAGFEVSFPEFYAQHISKISTDSWRILEQARGHAMNLSQIQFYYNLRNDPARRTVLSTLIPAIGDDRHSQFKSGMAEAHLLPQNIPNTFITTKGKIKAIFLAEIHQVNMDSVGHLVKTNRVKDKFRKMFGDDQISVKFVAVGDFMLNQNFYETLNLRLVENESYIQALSENIVKTETHFFPDYRRKLKNSNLLNENGIFNCHVWRNRDSSGSNDEII